MPLYDVTRETTGTTERVDAVAAPVAAFIVGGDHGFRIDYQDPAAVRATRDDGEVFIVRRYQG